MGRFTRDELLAALDHYTATVEQCSATGEWSPFADLFTEDVTYIEHAYGEMHGREEVRSWIVAAMAPFPQMRFPRTWVAIDEDNDALVMEVRNVLDHPSEPGVEFGFPNITRLVYAGDNRFSSEEDVYNPTRDAPHAVGGWIKAGGQLRTEPLPLKHV
jgi:hypothetical protein